ncbi:MAG: Crp/Fnr family transcriptional regulator [Burkholderiaceae bacterium]
MSTPEIEPLLLKLLSSIILFRGLEREELVDLLRGASKVVFNPGELVFEEGFPGHSLYVVMQGKFEVFKKIDGAEAHIAAVSTGEHFGEIALVTEQPRTASVRALEKSVALRLTKSAVFAKPKVAVYLLKNMAGLMAAHLDEMNNEVLLLDVTRQHLMVEDDPEEDDLVPENNQPGPRVRHSR